MSELRTTEISASEYRQAARLTAQALFELEAPPEHESDRPSIADHLPGIDMESPEAIRTERYAFSSALGTHAIRETLILPGDPLQPQQTGIKFSRATTSRPFTILDPQRSTPGINAAADPYLRFMDDLSATARQGFQTFFDKRPEKGHWLAETHDGLARRDYYLDRTRLPIYAANLAGGIEGPPEIAGLAAAVQYAISLRHLNGRPHDTHLFGEERRRDITHQVANGIGLRRITWGLNPFLIRPKLYSYHINNLQQTEITTDSLRMAERNGQEVYALDFGDQMKPVATPEEIANGHTDVNPHLKCPIHFLKPTSSRLSHLQLFVHGGINRAHQEGLFDPDLVPPGYQAG